MPITNTNVTVLAGSSAATVLTPLSPFAGDLQDPMPVSVYNPGVTVLYVGGPAVTTGNGIPIGIGAVADFSLVRGDVLYGITGTVTTTVNVMKGRQ